MGIEDLLGFGKASEKLINVVSAACGTLYRPLGIRREAAAKADEIRLLGNASAEAEAAKIRIVGLANAEQNILVADTDIEILHRAKARLITREIQRQSNIENIVEIALSALPEEVSEEPVEDDWRVRFFNVAEDITDAEMQTLWGKILAGEVARPGRFSLRTLDVLRNLSKHEAEVFQRACGLAFTRGWMARLIPTTNTFEAMRPGSSALDFKEFGLTLDHLLTLMSAGLLAPGDALTTSFPKKENRVDETKQQVVVVNNGIPIVLEAPLGIPLTFESYVFSTAGKELKELIEPSPNIEYLRLLAKGLRLKNISMYRSRHVGESEFVDIAFREDF